MESIRAVAPLEVGLCVADLDRSLAFYQDGLGFIAVSDIVQPPDRARASGLASHGYRVVRLQAPFGERVKLFHPRSPLPPPPPAPAPLDRRGFAFLTVIVADLRGALNVLAPHRGPASMPEPVELRPGTWVALVHDPDGIVVELVSYDDLVSYRSDLAERHADVTAEPPPA